MRRTKQSTQRGFTIVELITIIIVIGILATIGIVSWSGAQNRARQNSFQANAEQVKLKLGEYFTEHNYYPPDKDSVCVYLAAINSGTLHDEFCTEANSAAYEFTASATALPTVTACHDPDDPIDPVDAPVCITYEITVALENWNGSGTDTDIIVRP